MKKINYETIIPNSVGPRLTYHGFKYDETQSYPPQGHYCFTRNYWCTTQRVSICPIEYDLEDIEAVISKKDDFPTEVPTSLLLIQEPGFRLWLSHKYLTAVLESGHRSINLLPNEGTVWDGEAINAEELIQTPITGPPPQAGEKLPTWWEFHGEDDLRRVLSEIVQITVFDGLDWFDRSVRDIRRYHEKLDQRRRATRENSPEDS